MTRKNLLPYHVSVTSVRRGKNATYKVLSAKYICLQYSQSVMDNASNKQSSGEQNTMILGKGDSRATYLHIYIREGTALRIYYKPIIAHISNASRGDMIYRQDDDT